VETGSDIKMLIEGFQKMNVNILEKLDNIIKPTVKKTYYSQERSKSAWSGECYYCKETGHRRYECPKLNLQSKTDLGCLEIAELSAVDGIDLHGLDKRDRDLTGTDGGSEDDQNNSDNSIKKNKLKRFKMRNTKSDFTNYQILKEVPIPKTKVRRPMEIKLSSETENYSIKNDLVKMVPNINSNYYIVIKAVIRTMS
ncbi:hypothetical protein BB561_006461, partial [Smittium simulii]